VISDINSKEKPPSADAFAKMMCKRFAGYLTGDSANYLLGFAIYGWLVRSLTDKQYGHLSVGTSIYQAFVMAAALGLDLIGPRLLAEHARNLGYVVERVQAIRLKFAFYFCLPALLLISVIYRQAHQVDVSLVLVASFCMVVARAFDVGYVAIALAKPRPLVYSRALGLSLYLLTIIVLRHTIATLIWLIPVLNALGVMVGRLQLMRSMHLSIFGRDNGDAESYPPIDWHVLTAGVKTSAGQLVLFSFQTLDVVLLNRYVDASSVGQYAMVSRLYLFGTAVLTCVLNAFIPELISSRGSARFHPTFRKFIFASAVVGLGGAIVLWLSAPAVTEILGGRTLEVVRRVSPVFALVFFTMSMANVFVSFLPSLELEKEYLVSIAVGAAVVLAADLLLIPRFAVAGAAWGQLAGTVAMAAWSAAAIFQGTRRTTSPLLARANTIGG
jgi:O-antigen/teichoic acid export membrane protein